MQDSILAMRLGHGRLQLKLLRTLEKWLVQNNIYKAFYALGYGINVALLLGGFKVRTSWFFLALFLSISAQGLSLYKINNNSRSEILHSLYLFSFAVSFYSYYIVYSHFCGTVSPMKLTLRPLLYVMATTIVFVEGALGLHVSWARKCKNELEGPNKSPLGHETPAEEK